MKKTEQAEQNIRALCTKENEIRRNYYSVTHRASFSIEDEAGEWDITHIEIPFPPQMEAEYMRRFSVSREALPEVYQAFSRALRNHLEISNELANLSDNEAVQKSVVRYRLIKVFTRKNESGEVEHTDVYWVTEPMTALPDSPLMSRTGTCLKNINTLALSLLQITKTVNSLGFSLGGFDLDSVYLTVNKQGVTHVKTGFFFYGTKDSSSTVSSFPPDASAVLYPGVIEEGCEQNYDTDIFSLCRLLWTLYDGQCYDSTCDLSFAPQYAPDAVTKALTEGLEKGASAVQLISNAIRAWNKADDEESTDNDFIVFVPPLYLSQPLPELRSEEKKGKKKPSGEAEAQTKKIGMPEATVSVFHKSLSFEGRTSRREFLLYCAFRQLLFLQVLTGISIFLITKACQNMERGTILTLRELLSSQKFILIAVAGALLLLAVPTLSAFWRRMHDAGQKGWISLLPGLRIIMAMLSGQQEENIYGEPASEDCESAGNKSKLLLNFALPLVMCAVLGLEVWMLSDEVYSYREKRNELSRSSGSLDCYEWNGIVVSDTGEQREEYILDESGNLLEAESGKLIVSAEYVERFIPMDALSLTVSEKNYELPEDGESLYRIKPTVIDLTEEKLEFDLSEEAENILPADIIEKYGISEDSILILNSAEGRIAVEVKMNREADAGKEYSAVAPEKTITERELRLAQGRWEYVLDLAAKGDYPTNTSFVISTLDEEHLYFAVEKESGTVYTKALSAHLDSEGHQRIVAIGRQEGKYSLRIESGDGSFSKLYSLTFEADEDLLATRASPSPQPDLEPAETPAPSPSPTPTARPTYSTDSGSHTVYVYVTPSPAPTVTPAPEVTAAPESSPAPITFSCDVTELTMAVGDTQRIFPTESCSISLSEYGIIEVNPENFEVTALKAGECDIILTCTLAQLKGQKLTIHVVVI